MTEPSLSAHRRWVRFVAVGSAAALLHWGAAVLVVRSALAPPLIANVAGWLAAFFFSFAGQYGLTFADQRAPAGRAMRRFFALSASGFAVNEAAYAALLRWSPWRYDVLLAVVLGAVAIATYLLSRRWAFAGTTVLR